MVALFVAMIDSYDDNVVTRLKTLRAKYLNTERLIADTRHKHVKVV